MLISAESLLFRLFGGCVLLSHGELIEVLARLRAQTVVLWERELLLRVQIRLTLQAYYPFVCIISRECVFPLV